MERFKFTEALETQPATMLKEGQKESFCKADAKKHNGALEKERDLALDAKTLSDGPNLFRAETPFCVNDSNLSVSTAHACGQHCCHAKRVHPLLHILVWE